MQKQRLQAIWKERCICDAQSRISDETSCVMTKQLALRLPEDCWPGTLFEVYLSRFKLVRATPMWQIHIQTYGV